MKITNNEKKLNNQIFKALEEKNKKLGNPELLKGLKGFIRTIAAIGIGTAVLEGFSKEMQKNNQI